MTARLTAEQRQAVAEEIRALIDEHTAALDAEVIAWVALRISEMPREESKETAE